jgi:hypothetical protein
MTTAIDKATSKPARPREWMPRIWEGINTLAWLRLLVRNRFAVSLPCLYIAVIISMVSIFNTLMAVLQWIWYGSRVRRTVIREAPIFIIGHWRTGTTLLHELLILDPRHTCPTTYECMAANHFLVTESWLPRLFWFLMPARRPMDNMAAGWDRPQEDEFALCMLGQPSPYLTIAFPNRPPQDTEAFDLEGLSPAARNSWKRAFVRLLQALTLKDPRRLVLKSPTHSCRIKVLLELFPDARFVHILRDPYVVFPSTVNLWKSLYQTHGLQKPTYAGLEEYVYTTFLHLYQKLEVGKQRLAPDRYYEMRYEDLVRDPIRQMQALYEHLGLNDFEAVRPRLQEYLASVSGYQTNRYEMSPELRSEITRRWGDVIRRYGYEQTPAEVTA